MRKKIIFYVLLIFVFVTTQVTFLNFISIWGARPNLLVILIVCISLLEGGNDGAVVGFFAGLCQDAAVGVALGIHALIGMLVGLLFGNINKRFFKENIFVMIFCTVVATILYESAAIFSSYLMVREIDYYNFFKTVILPETLFNCVLGAAIFIVVILTGKKFVYSDTARR